MNTWNPRANDLFLHAAELSSDDERRALVERECSGDVALQNEVEALLTAFAQVENFLEAPAGVSETIELPPTEDCFGTASGPYKLLEPLGEGGFGMVFVAEQTQPVRRKVALKVLKPGMDTRHVVARFEAERQALAIMDHSNIARVFDGGATPTGRIS